MAFHIPVIGTKRDPHLKVFDFKDLSMQKDILGRGSFGVAYKTKYKNKTVVIKELLSKEWSETGKKFLKEAKIMQSCESIYIVKFHAVSYSPLAFMMDYVYFDFTAFGGTQTLSSLEEFLEFCDNFEFKSIEGWPVKISKDVTKGLLYLHNNNIVCRDLKPANVLISNQHYIDVSDKSKKKAIINECPIICKLTDFGEARSQLLQTKTLISTKTNCVNRGTLAFMAPEIIRSSRQLTSAAQQDLERADIWALGMLFQCVISPDSQPFLEEVKKNNLCGETLDNFIVKMFSLGNKPSMTDKYLYKRVDVWSSIFIVCELATQIEPCKRADLLDIDHFLNRENGISVSMNVSQATALEKFDFSFAKGTPEDELLTNDGTNSCCFLCLKIASVLFQSSKSRSEIVHEAVDLSEDVIRTYPRYLNAHRDISKMYEPSEALTIMKSFDEALNICKVEEVLSCNYTVFSRKGMADLLITLQRLKKETFTAVYVCEPYSFLIVRLQHQMMIVDTHPVPGNCGGNGNGLVFFALDDTNLAHGDLCKWIWKRLYLSGVKNDRGQSLSIVR